MTTEITRVTMIKLPSEEHVGVALEGFEKFTQSQQRDGKPYILSMQAGAANGNVKDQGFNFVTKSVFKNKDDMKYYETECAGHNEYKLFLKEKAPVAGLMTLYFTPGYSYTK